MKIDHLGDALDHWKGSILLQSSQWTKDLKAEPMITYDPDKDHWNREEFMVYSRLLGLPLTHVLQHEWKQSNRCEYFKETQRQVEGDIFVDPSTGIEPNNFDRNHIRVEELLGLMKQDNLVLLYQHRRQGGKLRQTIEQVVKQIHAVQKVCGFTYEATSVAMLFLSRSPERLTPIREHLEKLLGNTKAKERIACF